MVVMFCFLRGYSTELQSHLFGVKCEVSGHEVEVHASKGNVYKVCTKEFEFLYSI